MRRTLAREPEAGAALAAEARHFAERAATPLAASVLLRHAPDAVSGSYVAGRLGPDRGWVAGAVSGLDEGAPLARLGAGYSSPR